MGSGLRIWWRLSYQMPLGICNVKLVQTGLCESTSFFWDKCRCGSSTSQVNSPDLMAQEQINPNVKISEDLGSLPSQPHSRVAQGFPLTVCLIFSAAPCLWHPVSCSLVRWCCLLLSVVFVSVAAPLMVSCPSYLSVVALSLVSLSAAFSVVCPLVPCYLVQVSPCPLLLSIAGRPS